VGGLVRIDQQTLATAAALSKRTIQNIEDEGAAPIMAHANTIRKIQAVLEELGVEFLDENRPGVRLRAGTKK
jgi:hypothetical protein